MKASIDAYLSSKARPNQTKKLFKSFKPTIDKQKPLADTSSRSSGSRKVTENAWVEMQEIPPI